MPYSTVIDERVLNAVLSEPSTFIAASFTDTPETIYVQLHSADPTGACTASVIGSTRKGLTFSNAASGAITNDSAASWGSGEHGTGTQTITHISLWDASSGGNALIYGALASSKQVQETQTFTIAVGDLDVTAITS